MGTYIPSGRRAAEGKECEEREKDEQTPIKVRKGGIEEKRGEEDM